MARRIVRTMHSILVATFWFLLGIVMSTKAGTAWYVLGPVASALYLLTHRDHVHPLLHDRPRTSVVMAIATVALIHALFVGGGIRYEAKEATKTKAEAERAKRAEDRERLAGDRERQAEERERQAMQSNEGLRHDIADLRERLAGSKAENERLAGSNAKTEEALAENKRSTDEIKLGIARLSAPPESRLIRVFEKNVELSQGKVTLRMHLVSASPKEWRFILDEFKVTACGHVSFQGAQAKVSPGQPFPLVMAKDAALIVYVIALPNGTYVPWIGLVPPDPKLKTWASPMTVDCKNNAFS